MPYCYELFGSRSGGSTETELRFIVLGANDDVQAEGVLWGEAPLTYRSLVRDVAGLKREQVGVDSWEFRIPYKPAEASDDGDGGGGGGDPDSPHGIIDFDTTGGTTHITQCIQQVDYGPEAAPDIRLARAIGVHKDGVEGVDIVVPQMELTAKVTYEPDEITSAYIYELMKLTGKVNAAPFPLRGMTFLIGELLFLGATGTSAGRPDWEITYRFSASPNRQNLVISPTITVASKRGHDYLWVMYKVDEKNDRFCHVPDVAFVSKVYEETDFGPVLGVL